ncbi:DEAD/DEAH box helicase [Marinagarivorans algicola]|uniref:DEAD/DEAH box helicase n=1 Tax=Marinagarivorans algicola TaxID=1513270 RepID=UPI0006B3FB0C|nr:DEAD/DEAH box helicase [Marinagarivorans algicola]
MTQPSQTFEQLGLNSFILSAIKKIGYETPSPIQEQAIPVVLKGRDILGQAQTGTGKTAAFALPILQMVDASNKKPQVLILAPTRELAIQVAEAFQSFAKDTKGFHVLPVYGGQGYEQQIRALKRGAQVIVGTPGRVMDHMRKGTLNLESLTHLVLDEADEMLRMGFIDDVEWVLERTPPKRQIALFSATMPKEIARVANTYLQNPAHVKVESKTTTGVNIRQRYWPVGGVSKVDALTRILEAETFDAVIMFVRTKTATVELAEKLEARGYSAAALNGDISQNIRERTVERLKSGKVDILIATDVAARGLDVDRISHVINYDIPYDSEAYVHRIGRTGRAGRSGDAILFVARREMRMLRTIERATGKDIEQMKLPSVTDINAQRQERFKQQILETISGENLDIYTNILKELQTESEADPLVMAAALAKMAHGEHPLFLEDRPERTPREFKDRDDRNDRGRDRNDRGRDRGERSKRREVPQVPMESYRLEVGRSDGVRPGNIVGAIANEADISSQHIHNIRINDSFSTVELPAGMPTGLLNKLRGVWVCQKQLQISQIKEVGGSSDRNERNSEAPKKPRAKRVQSDKPRKSKESVSFKAS